MISLFGSIRVLMLLPVLLLQSPGQEVKEAGTLRIRITGVIGWQQVALVSKALRQAESGGIRTVVIDLDTPGGSLNETRQLVTLIQNIKRGLSQDTRVVAFVNPQALSGGAIVALSTGEIYMREDGVIGDAYPIQIDPLTGSPSEIPEGIREKQLSALRAQMRQLGEAFPEGRRETAAILAEGMVDPRLEIRRVKVKNKEGVSSIRILDRRQEELEESNGNEIIPLEEVAPAGKLVTITARQALEFGLAEGLASDWDDFIRLMGLDSGGIREIKLSATERVVDFIESISFLLLLGGLFFGIMAFKIPGFGIPEVLALACFLLLFIAHYFTGLAGWLEPLLFMAGVGFLAIELFVLPGTIVSGILGGLLVIGSLILSFQGFLWPENELQSLFLEENLWYFLCSVLFIVAGAFILSRFLPKVPLFAKVILDTPGELGRFSSRAGDPELAEKGSEFIGNRGVAETDLRPAGRALFNGDAMDVQTEGEFIVRGTGVEVIRCDSNRLIVRAIVKGEDS